MSFQNNSMVYYIDQFESYAVNRQLLLVFCLVFVKIYKLKWNEFSGTFATPN